MDCTLSARRVYSVEEGEEVTSQAEMVVIDFAAVDGTSLREEEVILVHSSGARAHVGRIAHPGEAGVKLAHCVSGVGTPWSCEPVEGEARGLMMRSGEQARDLLRAMRRAVTLCIAED